MRNTYLLKQTEVQIVTKYCKKNKNMVIHVFIKLSLFVYFLHFDNKNNQLSPN